MTRQQIASMNVHPVDNPQNSLITLSDLREAARSCGFTTDPYSTPIISITHHGNMGCRVFKLERFLPKNQHTRRKILNFENWCNGEVSKIGHHFRK